MKTLLCFLFSLLPLAAQVTGDYQVPKWDGTKFVPQLITPAANSVMAWNGSGQPIATLASDFATAANLTAGLATKQPLATVLTNTTAAFTTAQETKLSGIATGATANSADAFLLARANHTGSQAQSTITNLVADLNAKESAIAAGTTGQYWRGDKTWQALGSLATLTPGVGVTAVLESDIGQTGSVVVNGGAYGTPSSLTLTNAGGLPIAGITGLGTGVPDALALSIGGAGAIQLNNGSGAGLTGIPLSGLAQSSATAGQVPTWNGSEWVAGSAPIYGQLAADYTLTSTTANQKLFNFSANGAVTLPTGRYRFSMMLHITGMSGTSGNAVMSILGSGTATIANVLYTSKGLDSGTPLTSATQTGAFSETDVMTVQVLQPATGTAMAVQLSGVFNVTATGTLIPSIGLITAAAAVVKAGSYFECVRLGPTGSNTQGPWQ